MDPQVRRDVWELIEELRGDGVTVVLTTHYMDEAERLADRIHIIDQGRLVASGSPLELTRGGRMSTIRLVVTRPFPPGRPGVAARPRSASRPRWSLLDELSLLVTGPADASTLAKVSRWCEENDVLPESLTLGTRNLEDVFLELTGRELARAWRVSGTFTPQPGAAPLPRMVLAQARMESRLHAAQRRAAAARRRHPGASSWSGWSRGADRSAWTTTDPAST